MLAVKGNRKSKLSSLIL